MTTNATAYQPLGYRPALDGLRALAVAAVVGFHYASSGRPFLGGFLGVYLFFVLSGFLITRLLLDERAATARVALPAFYRRRIARLVPSFLVMGLAVLVLSELGATIYGSHAIVRTGFVTSATYTSNWYAITHGWLSLGDFTPMWSLAVEEQFYLLWPLTLIFLLRRHDPARTGRFVVVATVLVFAQVAIRSLFWPNAAAQLWGTDAAPMAALLLGCAAALLWFTGYEAVRPAVERRVRAYWPIAAAALVAFVLTLGQSNTRLYARGGFVIADVSMVVLLGAAYIDTPLRRFLASRPLVYVGRRSYEIYLWQIVVYVTAAWAFARVGVHPNALVLGVSSALATVAFAEITYRFVGRPLRAAIAHRTPAEQRVSESRTRP
jgi:peptidoglycan/LPS O-acetylase OafA/YrhL